MRKTLFKSLFILAVFLPLPSFTSAATPTISNVSGTVSNGQTLTISGSNMIQENKANWDGFFSEHSTAYGFEGSRATDGYSEIGPSGGVYVSDVKLMGSKSIKFHSQGAWPAGAGGLGNYAAVNPRGTSDSGDIWVRFYVRWNLLGGAWPTNYMKIMDSQGGAGNQYYLDMAGTASGQPTMFNATYDSASHNIGIPGGPLVNNRWYTVEINWKSSSPRSYKLWVDGVQLLNATPSLNSTVNYLLFGIINLAGTNSSFSLDEWMDGLAFGSSRIYPASTIEVSGDGVNWKYQEPVYLSETSSQIKLNLSGLTGTSYRIRVTNNRQETSATYSLSGGGTTPPPTPTDTTPPVISNPQPASTLAFGTVSTTMRVTTNENATCKYGTSNTTYASLPNTFTTTGGTTHSKTLTGLTNSSSVTYYVRCVDGSNNANTTSTVISVVVPGTTSVVNGACGSANGQSFSTLTSTSPNLCSAGTVGSFSGTGPWSWRCNRTNGGTYATCSATLSQQTSGTLLFSETFDNNSFSSRGWYDNAAHGTVVSGGQSSNALQWAWAQGATTPTNGGAMRKKFTPTDSLYVSFYVKFQSGWRGSQKAYHPHLIMIPSNLDADYTPLANNYLQTYIEFVSDVGSPYTIRPLLGLQDEKRVNTSNGTPPNNLTAVTENRSVNYCNTPVSSGALGTCYADNPYYSANTWKASNASLSTNVWHKVDVYFKMNTISNNKGQSNGIMQQWVDGTLVINRSDVLYRTAQDATKKWAQFVLAPYIGDGSPIAQTMWLDQLTVSTSGSGTGTTPPPSGGDTTPPAVPTGVTVS